MSNRLGGKQGTAYTGTNADQPPNWNFNDRNPNQYDTQNYSIGDLWLNTDSLVPWMLVSLQGDIYSRGALATWIPLTGGGAGITNLQGDSGGQVFSNVASTVFVVGDGATVVTTGNTVPNTLTLSVGSRVPTTFMTANGSAIPSGNVINFAGTGGIVASAGGSTVTLDGSGVIGNCITQITANAGSSGGVVLPAMGNLNIYGRNNITTTANLTANTLTIDVSGTTNHAIQIGNSNGSLTSLTAATNGQLPIGSTGNDPVMATLTQGTGIAITNNPGSIAIAASGAVATAYVTNAGTAIPAANSLNVVGGNGISTGGGTNIVTINSTATFVTDFLTATPTSGGQLTIAGAGGITTSASGSTVTISGSGGGGGITGLTGGNGNTATANMGIIVFPNGNNISTVASNGANSMTINVSGTTQYAVQVGSSIGALASVSPGVTTGVPLVSQGTAANPIFGTATVPGGGTGITAAGAPYAPICAGTLTTAPFQTASAGISNAGYVLTSNGSAALPSWQAAGVSPAAGNSFSAYSLGASRPFTLGVFLKVPFTATYFNNGGYYNTTTSTYTAPATGLYVFFVSISLDNISGTTLTEYSMQLVTTARNYLFSNFNPYASAALIGAAVSVATGTPLFCAMSAGDTAYVQVLINQRGGGTPNANITPDRTTFAGYRVA